MKADVILDLSYGDCGKGKVSKYLSEHNKYTHCLRFNGGPNAGHTIYHFGKKFVTHQLPCGIFHNIKSVIGATCVVNIEDLFKEIDELESAGINAMSLLKIANNAHIITNKHLEEDGKDIKIGTTKKGIGPCYVDKYNRTGLRAKDVSELKPFLVDVFDELNTENSYILCEGAQGFYLDIDWGDYPYVTSSPCTLSSVIQNGISHKKINKVYGVIKAYETYVGAKKFQPDDEVFNQLRELGNEYGATTGRPRQCNWLNIGNLIKAIKFNGVNELIINKCDVIRNLNKFGLIYPNGEIKIYQDYFDFRADLGKSLENLGIEVTYSFSPDTI